LEFIKEDRDNKQRQGTRSEQRIKTKNPAKKSKSSWLKFGKDTSPMGGSVSISSLLKYDHDELSGDTVPN
jgi:hypothetical protein